MHANTAITKTEILDAIVARIGERLPEGQAALVGAFTRHYYRGTDIRDLQQHDLADLYGAVLAHYNLAARRAAGSTKLHVYNPQLEQHGWQSTHTVIEVVCDDSPFLVDSLRLALNRHGLTCHLLIHPVFHLHRDGQGRLREVLAEETASDDVRVEAVMHFEVDRQTEPEVLQALEQELVAVLAQVHRVVGDWQPMLEQLNRVVAELEQHPPPLSQAEVDQALAFLRWVAAEHFTFLGYREYDLFDEADGLRLQAREGSGLGLLRDGDGGEARGFAMLDSDGQRQATAPELLVVTKTSRRSTVHRPAFMDYIGIKRLDDQGRVVGEYRFLGLYSASAYNRSAREIPLLQQKVDRVLEQAGYPRGSHARRALLNILESYPRDELFQTTPDELLEITLGILHLQERQRVSLFVRRDPYGRFISCLVFAPRERFSTEVRQAITRVLESSFGGECLDFSLQISESALARIHFLIGVRGGQPASSWDLEEIEQRLAATTRDWRDDLADALLDHFGEERGTALLRRYGSAFRADYREHYPASVACYDIARMEQLVDGAELAMTLYRPPELPPSQLRFKLFQAERPTPLSETLPMLENMGLKVIEESPTTIHPAAQAPLWIHDFGLEHREEGLDLALITDKFQETFARVWRGEVENDGFNRLVLRAQLEWRQIVVLRAYCKYLRQVRATFSQEYMERTLDANPRIARLLAELFMARFDPTQAGDPQAEAELIHQIDEALDAVSNLDEDRILRGFLHAIHATLRTNYFQRGADGQPKKYLSFKFDPARVPDMPEPRPLFEIFVYSPRVEGVHLRGGKVARGGLRWSDRREDFRTEVLGLVKAQMVKNAVIVPVGSKGGFVCKALPGGNDREALQAEVVASYKTFISGLLDLTDNLVDGAVVPPPEVVRHDPDDPYLVVAADKGTATFSDIANGVARDYGFWLDDAFASGGSAGYDHKKMGITARGGWESVKRHFRELGLDTQTQDFTVAGIGDMSGDVFGNGMLLSEHSRLVAAFDHRHIFIDPAPDPARSFAERRRLFALPRSSWDDYQRKLLSAGGGIWPRSVKSIELPPEARQALGVEQTRFSPNELIRAILKAPVDLLWNGGIGTYVKARNENHADVGDRSSDAVRVDAPELRCRVVGEGGNLGLTQRARIEFAQHGGRINTDAIDNSGGVDCSDHEVNIKILLNAVVTAGDMTRKQRDRLCRPGSAVDPALDA
ncbi:MAG TPA: NAD-glutamate dehydrogenase, partial [Gammaproteobacteria bacterium]